MNTNEKINLLVTKLSYYAATAKAYVESNGKCVYCGIDIFDDPHLYAKAAIDHLFPKCLYRALVNETENLVLSCSYCNNKKHNFDPMELEIADGKKAEDILKDKGLREQVIDGIRKEISLSEIKTKRHVEKFYNGLKEGKAIIRG